MTCSSKINRCPYYPDCEDCKHFSESGISFEDLAYESERDLNE